MKWDSLTREEMFERLRGAGVPQPRRYVLVLPGWVSNELLERARAAYEPHGVDVVRPELIPDITVGVRPPGRLRK